MSEEEKVNKRDFISGDTPIFITEKPNNPDSVFGWIQSMVHNHGGHAGGPGMEVEEAVQHMLKNFQPKKSANFGRTYCRTYIAGGVKEGHLTTDRTNAAQEPQLKLPKSGISGSDSRSDSSGLTKKGADILDSMAEIIDEDDFRNDRNVLTVQALAENLGRKMNGISRSLSSLEKNGFVDVVEVQEEIPSENETEEPKKVKVKYVKFTEEGWNNSRAE